MFRATRLRRNTVSLSSYRGHEWVYTSNLGREPCTLESRVTSFAYSCQPRKARRYTDSRPCPRPYIRRNATLLSCLQRAGLVASLARLSGNQDFSAQPYGGGTQSNLDAYMLCYSVSASAYAATRPQNKARALASKVDPHAYSLLASSPAAATALRIPTIRSITASTDRLCDRSLQSIAAQSAAHDGK